ncbi:hypothetical protein THRCLA_22127 [Thraustotheca clavata]|uniref:Hsp70-Hsp90 organising protein n=1 Tax=Thraustotheca clavata TaxID=74557 RepID=A0A1V9ZC66_9STRA|nr:hypothetical protein THRCLA_22127 [Thraustotheca clavata]
MSSTPSRSRSGYVNPMAATMEPKRMQLLRAILRKALDASVNDASALDMTDYLPLTNVDFQDEVGVQVIQNIRNRIEVRFDELCSQYGLCEKFAELEKLIQWEDEWQLRQEAGIQIIAPQRTEAQTPQDLLTLERVRLIRQEKKRLEQQLQEIHQANTNLEKSITETQSSASSMLSAMESRLDTIARVLFLFKMPHLFLNNIFLGITNLNDIISEVTMANAKAEAKKNEGNEFFKRKDYAHAIEKYSEAIALDVTNHVYFSNRSAAYAGLNQFAEAAADGEQCIKLNPKFVKGYHRQALGLKGLKDYAKALEVLKAGQRVDFNNNDLNKLINEIEPLLAKAQTAKRAGMGHAEKLKEQGNDLFKSAQFEKAIEVYTEAIDSCDKDSSPLAISCYNNRAACHQQLSNFSAVIRDCSHVLELEPNNQKALLRRGLAYEGLERYRLALQDIRALLALDPSIEIANKAQHRIGAAVRALKDM